MQLSPITMNAAVRPLTIAPPQKPCATGVRASALAMATPLKTNASVPQTTSVMPRPSD